MATPEVGIKITVRDLATRAIKAVGVGAAATGKSVRLLAKAMAGTGAAFGDAMTRINQTLEIVNKFRAAIRMIAADTVATSIEFRRAMDPMAVWFRRWRTETRLTSAAIGDIWLPLLRGVDEAIDEVVGSMGRWARSNRELIATRLIEYFAPAADVIGVLVRGFALVSRSALGLKALFHLVSQGLYKLAETSYGALERMTGSVVTLMAKLGQHKLAATIGQAATAFGTLRVAAELQKDEAAESVQETANLISEIEKGADRATDAIDRIAKRAAANARKWIAQDAGSGRILGAAADAHADKMLALELRLHEARSELSAMRIRWAEEDAARLLALEQERARKTAETAIAFATTWSDAFAHTLMASHSLNEALKAGFQSVISAALDAAQRFISIQAAEAAAAAVKGPIGIPVVGPILAASAASAALAMVKGFMTQMATGGIVHGGMPGRDSVPAMLMPGERVLTPTQSRAYEARSGAAGGTQMHVTISPQVTTQLPPTREQQAQIVDALAPAIEQAMMDGRLRLVES